MNCAVRSAARIAAVCITGLSLIAGCAKAGPESDPASASAPGTSAGPMPGVGAMPGNFPPPEGGAQGDLAAGQSGQTRDFQAGQWPPGGSSGMPGGGMPGVPGASPTNNAAALESLVAWERHDMGVKATRELHSGAMHAPTPNQLPGGQVITTQTLLPLLQGGTPIVLLHVLQSQQTLPNALMAVPASAPGSFNDATQQQFKQFLQQVTRGRQDVPIVTYCEGPECWMSYNAALRAIALGYRNVQWYRGGMEAWQRAGLQFAGGPRTYGPAPQQPAGDPEQAGNYPQQPGGYPQQPGSYPQQPGGYPQQPGNYPQQPGGYPQQPGNYPQQPGGYPQQPGSYPQQPGGYPQQPGGG